MSWRHLDTVLKDVKIPEDTCRRHQVSECSAAAVLAFLAFRANDAGIVPGYAVATIAHHTRMSERAARRALRVLEEAGLIAPTMANRGGRHGATRYRLSFRVSPGQRQKPGHGGRVSSGKTQVEGRNPVRVAAKPGHADPLNHPNDSEGGGVAPLAAGAGGASASAPPHRDPRRQELLEASIPRISAYLRAEIEPWPALIDELDRLSTGGWNHDHLSVMFGSWPKTIKSSATGLALTKLKRLPDRPEDEPRVANRRLTLSRRIEVAMEELYASDETPDDVVDEIGDVCEAALTKLGYYDAKGRPTEDISDDILERCAEIVEASAKWAKSGRRPTNPWAQPREEYS